MGGHEDVIYGILGGEDFNQLSKFSCRRIWIVEMSIYQTIKIVPLTDRQLREIRLNILRQSGDNIHDRNLH